MHVWMYLLTATTVFRYIAVWCCTSSKANICRATNTLICIMYRYNLCINDILFLVWFQNHRTKYKRKEKPKTKMTMKLQPPRSWPAQFVLAPALLAKLLFSVSQLLVGQFIVVAMIVSSSEAHVNDMYKCARNQVVMCSI